MKRFGLFLFLSLVLSLALLGSWFLLPPRAEVQRIGYGDILSFPLLRTQITQEGVTLSFSTPATKQPLVGYDVRYTLLPFAQKDFLEHWDTLSGKDDGTVRMLSTSFVPGTLQEIALTPSSPGRYFIALRGVYADGRVTSLFGIERVHVPLLSYHQQGALTPTHGVSLEPIGALELKERERESFLFFTVPRQDIVSYSLRYLPGVHTKASFEASWDTASCERAGQSCVFYEDVTMEYGHREKMRLNFLPEFGAQATYALRYTTLDGKLSPLSEPVVVEGKYTPPSDITYLEFDSGVMLYDALREVATVFEQGQTYLTWKVPREPVLSYEIRYAEGKLTQKELETAWDTLPCFRQECFYYPREKKTHDRVLLEELPLPGELYTYGIRYTLRDMDMLSKISTPVYIESRRFSEEHLLASAAQAQANASFMNTAVDRSLPPLLDLTSKDLGENILLQWTAPDRPVLSYQIHYGEGILTREQVMSNSELLHCGFHYDVQLTTVDTCAHLVLPLDVTKVPGHKEQLLVKKSLFPGKHTFFITYYTDEYKVASPSNGVPVQVTLPELSLRLVRRSAELLGLYGTQLSVIERAYAQGLVGESLEGLEPHLPIVRGYFARYLVLLKGGKIPQGIVPSLALYCDVDGAAWYYPYVYALYRSDVVEGYKGGNCTFGKLFLPENILTRAEGLKMLLSFYGIEPLPVETTPYQDVALDAWYAPYFAYAKEANLFTPDEEGKVFPDRPLTTLDALSLLVAFADHRYDEQKDKGGALQN